MTALEQLLINASSSSSAVTTVTSSSSSSTSVSLNSSKKNPNETANKTLALQNNNSKHLSRLVEVNSYTKGLSINTPNTNGSNNSINISNSSPKTSVELKENFSRLLKSTNTNTTTAATATTTTPPESPQNQLVDYLACNQMIIEKNESSSLERATKETNGTQKKSTNDLVILVEKSGICVKKAANVESGEIGIDINSNLIEGVNSDGGDGGLGDETLTKTVREDEVTNNDIESTTLNRHDVDREINEKFSMETQQSDETKTVIPSTTITNTIRASDDEDMPLMSVCQTPPQSAASSTSLVNDNPFLNLLNTSISSSTNNETSETLAAAAAVAVTLLPPPKVPQKNDSITDLNAFKTQLKLQHERLKENLRDSYQRLRLNQTKYFQSHIRRHLNKKANEEKVTPQIDDTSIDLLNSILTSNATTTPTTPNALLSSSSSTTHQTRLIDDIQYELLKQNEDKSHKRSSYLKELNLNVKKMKRSSTRRGGQLRVKQITHDDSDQTESECSSDESSSSDAENEFVDVVSETERESSSHTGSNLTTNGSATANAYWLMRRVQLGCEWQRVQLKMKMLQQKK